MFLNDINYIIKNINYLNLFYIKYKAINKELILNLNILVFKKERGAIYKGVRVLKFYYPRLINSF